MGELGRGGASDEWPGACRDARRRGEAIGRRRQRSAAARGNTATRAANPSPPLAFGYPACLLRHSRCNPVPDLTPSLTNHVKGGSPGVASRRCGVAGWWRGGGGVVAGRGGRSVVKPRPSTSPRCCSVLQGSKVAAASFPRQSRASAGQRAAGCTSSPAPDNQRANKP